MPKIKVKDPVVEMDGDEMTRSTQDFLEVLDANLKAKMATW